jgi:hypothetical protein
MSRRVAWLIAVLVPLGLLTQVTLAVLTWQWYTDRGPHLRDDLPVLDRAAADTLAAAGDNGAVAVNAVLRTRTCRLAPLRPGGVYTRRLEFYVRAGDETAFITGVARRLPARYRPHQTTSVDAGEVVTATAGRDVTLSIREISDGWIVAAAATGCTAGPPPSTDPTAPPGTPAATAITTLLARLGTHPVGVHRRTMGCVGGGTATTTAAISAATDSDRLPQRVPIPAGAHPYPAPSANRVAYRSGTSSVIVAGSDDGTAITVQYTTGC